MQSSCQIDHESVRDDHRSTSDADHQLTRVLSYFQDHSPSPHDKLLRPSSSSWPSSSTTLGEASSTVAPVSTTCDLLSSPYSPTGTRRGSYTSYHGNSLGRAYTPRDDSIPYTERAKRERAKRALEEVQEGSSLLTVPFEAEFLGETGDATSVEVVRSWRYQSRDGGKRGRLTIPSVISERLYHAIDEHLPHVARDETLRRALVYLELVALPDDRSGYLPFHQQAVAHIRQIPSQADRGEARVYQLATRLKETLKRDTGENLPLEIVDHRRGRNCTQIRDLSLPTPVERAFEAERGKLFLQEGRINLQTWARDRLEYRRRRRQNARKKANRTASRRGVPDRVRQLQRRLNSLKVQRFARLIKPAKPKLSQLARERAGSSSGRGIPYRNQLRVISDRLVPLYKFTNRTLRLTPAGPSLASLPTEMRRAVFDDYLEVDMSSAQLALAASLWGDLEDLRDFLSSPAGTTGPDNRQSQDSRQTQPGNANWVAVGRDWWHELTGWLSQELPALRYIPERDFERVKSVLKGFTYGLFFGMQKSNLITLGTPYAASTDRERYHESVAMMTTLFLGQHSKPNETVTKIGEALFHHPLVDQLLEKRDKMLSQIEEHGGITDCFGRFIETTEERGAESVLAEYMQNAELRVMLPVGEAVLEDGELRFGLWQHDGVTIAPRRREPWAYRDAYQKACEALQKGCNKLSAQLGVPDIETDLTVDYGSEFLK